MLATCVVCICHTITKFTYVGSNIKILAQIIGTVKRLLTASFLLEMLNSFFPNLNFVCKIRILFVLRLGL